MSYSFCPLGSWGDRVSPPWFRKDLPLAFIFLKRGSTKDIDELLPGEIRWWESSSISTVLLGKCDGRKQDDL